MDKIIPQNTNFFEKMTACFGDLSQFEQKIQQIAEIARIDLSQYEIDHLAVRMNENQTAEQWRAFLLGNAKILKESKVNGRPIGLFELEQAVDFFGQKVKIIELPFPKGKIYPVEGWEHIEAVIPMQQGESVDLWIERVCKMFNLNENSAIKLKISQPVVEGEQLPNPTIAINVKNATLGNLSCLKLHPYGINDVIRSESNF
nr:VOC family protein [uncultured Haemophilus sp.]